MPPRTSPAYWPKRTLLAIGTVSVVVILLWAVIWPVPVGPGSSNIELGPLSIDGALLGRALTVGIPVAGLLWMVRIYRRSEGDPPPWRYRDR